MAIFTYPVEDTNWVAKRKRIQESIEAESPKLDSFWKLTILANDADSQKPSVVVEPLLHAPANRNDYLEREKIFQAFEPLRELRNSLADGCDNSTARVKSRPVPDDKRHGGKTCEARVFDQFYLPSHNRMTKKFQTLDAARSTARELQQSLRQLINFDLTMNHNREMASVLFENEERMADVCERALRGFWH